MTKEAAVSKQKKGMSKFIQIATTASTVKEAEKISAALLKKRLAACVQIIGPIKSAYWWNKKIEQAKEWLLIIKTRKQLYGRVEKTIRKLHSYQTPEIIAIPITAGNKDYTKWLQNETVIKPC